MLEFPALIWRASIFSRLSATDGFVLGKTLWVNSQFTGICSTFGILAYDRLGNSGMILAVAEKGGAWARYVVSRVSLFILYDSTDMSGARHPNGSR